MAHLIDKDALVAEIEKLIANGKLKCQQSQENNDQVSYVAWSEHIATCGKILSLINTLEVKEVNSIDAFIEKAWNWIEDNMLSSNQQDKSRLYCEKFINYIKGE